MNVSSPTTQASWPGRDLEDVLGLDVDLDAVVHGDPQAALQAEADVVDLAQVRPDDRPDVLRPAPAWLVDRPSVGGVAELDQLERAASDRPELVRLSKAPSLESRHGRRVYALTMSP